MTDLFIKAGLGIAFIALGIFLYKLGNYIWGKPNRGGKRLLLFVFGLSLLTLCGLVFKFVELKSGKEIFILCLGIASGMFGIWLLFISCFLKPKELDKKFDDVINSL